MFTPIIRILLILGSLIMAILFYLEDNYTSMTWILIAAGLFVYGYFKYGTVYIAFNQIKKGEYKKAEKLIAKIKNPNTLSKAHKSYYHFTKGLIASEKEEWESSATQLTKALNIGLRTKNDTSIVLLNLAIVEFERNNFEKAKELLEKMKEYDLKPLIKTEMDKLTDKIDKKNNSKETL